MRRAPLLFLTVMVASLTAGCLPGYLVYPSGPYRGRVVDAETKQPLAGAAVVAVWEREGAVLGPHGPSEEYYDAVEVVTDAQGEFTIPAQTHFTLIGRIREPKLSVYYPGYIPYPELGTQPQGEAVDLAYHRKVFEIELPKAKSREERGRHADRPVRLGDVPESKIPISMTLINKERQELGLRPIGRREQRRLK
jgi:hypothetical protein